MDKQWKVFLFFLLCMPQFTKLQDCTLPKDIQNSIWVATGEEPTGEIEFTTFKIKRGIIWVQGDFKELDCVREIPENNIYVFSDNFHDVATDESRRLVLCFRLKKITTDLYYFYILADRPLLRDVRPKQLRYLWPFELSRAPFPNDTCQLCQASSPPNDTEYTILRRKGTNDSTAGEDFTSCSCNTKAEDCKHFPTTSEIPTTTIISPTMESTTTTTEPSTTTQPTTTRTEFTTTITTRNTTKRRYLYQYKNMYWYRYLQKKQKCLRKGRK